MNTLYYICIGTSWGIVIGFVVGGLKYFFRHNAYSEKKVKATHRFINRAGNALKYITISMLLLGLIWCVYFLIMGIVVPQQADYANNMAELIVAVLTVISILFAFIEFIRRKDDSIK